MRSSLSALAAAAVLAAGAVHAQTAAQAPVARGYADAPPAPAAAPTEVAPAAPAPATAPSAARAGADPTAAQIDAWLKADGAPVQTWDGAPPSDDLVAPRQIHGEVGAVVSNRGYGGFASASMPLGQASALDVAVAGGHVRTRWGHANPQSIAVGLYLDGGDVARWLSRDKCNVPRWGVALKGDPQVLPDGSCLKTDGPARTVADRLAPGPVAAP